MNRKFLGSILTFLILVVRFPAIAYATTENVTIIEIALGLEYYEINRFSEGMAGVLKYYSDTEQYSKYGFIDKTGKEVISLIYEYVYPFNEGLAAVKKDGRWGYIDKTGGVVVPFEYDYAGSFRENIASVRKDGKTYCIDKTGKVIMAFDYDGIEIFSEGLATAHMSDNGQSGTNRRGAIDKAGNIVVPFEYVDIRPFYEGLAAVKCLNYRWGFVDKKGKLVIPCEYDWDISGFSEGLAAVHHKDDNNWTWKFIDKSGTTVMTLNCSYVHNFSDGLATISRNGKLGYIDRTGENVIPCEYDWANSFSGGFAVVGQYINQTYHLKCGLIDKTGRVIIPLEYDEVLDLNESMTAVKKGEKWSILRLIKSESKNITVTFGATRYILNGQPFEQQTMVYNGVAYLPAAYLAEKLGLTAVWDAETNTTTLTSTGAKPPANSGASIVSTDNPVTRTIMATFGATQYILNSEPFDEQTIVYDGVAYLPAAYLATKLGLSASWDATTNITTLMSN